MSSRLQNKRCLIVGGTSGIGLAAGRRFLQERARLVVIGLEPQECELASDCMVLTGNVSSELLVDQMFSDAVQYLEGLDVVYHVAGSSGRKHGDGPLHECTVEGWQATFDANLKSTFLTNRAAVKQFLKQGMGGAILNMASVLALSPSPHYFDTVAYAAAKGGIIALSRQAAARYAGDKIRVNVLAPGLIDTPMATRATNDPAIMEFLQSKQPLGPGAGTADDCAHAAVFLCSAEARFITGVVLPIDGGWAITDGQWGNA